MKKAAATRAKKFKKKRSDADMFAQASEWASGAPSTGDRELVARFVLPLDLAPTLNRFAELQSYQRGKLKSQALRLMAQQAPSAPPEPLSGRPLVRIVRFSPTQPDADSGWPKVPVDRLTPKHGGLGFIADDKPSLLQLEPHWAKCAPGKSMVYLEVWTAKEDA